MPKQSVIDSADEIIFEFIAQQWRKSGEMETGEECCNVMCWVSKYLTASLAEIMGAALRPFYSHFQEQFGEIERRGQKNIFGLLTSAFVKAIYPEKKPVLMV